MSELRDDEPSNFKIGAAVIAGLCVLIQSAWVVAQALHEDKSTLTKESPHDLRGCLMVLNRVLKAYLDIEDADNDTIRMTIHRVIPDGAGELGELEQVVEYVGGKSGGAGRRFGVTTGIIGRCARERDVIKASRKSSDASEFVKELVTHWGYRERDAKALDNTRWSWMAVPLFGENECLEGVVYVDSSSPTQFEDEQAFEIIVSGCYGIASFIRWRYGGGGK